MVLSFGRLTEADLVSEAAANGFVCLFVFLPGVVIVIVLIVLSVASVSAAAALGFEIEIVEGDGCSADNGQEEKAIGQDGGIHLHQAGGEVDKEEPGSFGGIDILRKIEVVSRDKGCTGQQEGYRCVESLHFVLWGLEKLLFVFSKNFSKGSLIKISNKFWSHQKVFFSK